MKQVERIFRRLGVPVSPDDVLSQADRRLSADFLDRWNSCDVDGKMRLALESEDAAIIFALGQRDGLLRQEIPWILDVLEAQELNEASLVVDIGSGTGILPICINLIQRRSVVGYDPLPESQPLAQSLARRLGATVDARVGALGDLTTGDLASDVAVVVAQSVAPYTWGEHLHIPGHDWELAISRRISEPEGLQSEFANLMALASGSGLIVVDVLCAEEVASVVGMAAVRGLTLDLNSVRAFRARVSHETHTHHGLAFWAKVEVTTPTPRQLLDALEPPQETSSGGRGVTSGWPAERQAKELEPPVAAWSFTESTKENRVSISRSNQFCWVYQSSTDGARRLIRSPIAEWASIRQSVENELSSIRSTVVEVPAELFNWRNP